MFGFIVGVAVGGAIVWLGKDKLVAMYGKLVAKI